MSEKTRGFFLISEEKGLEQEPKVTYKNKNICRFEVPVLQESDNKNRNGRIYDWDTLYDGAMSPDVKELIDNNKFFCECGHPVEQTIERHTLIDRTNSSCLIKDLNFKKPYIGSNLVETTSTALGRDLMGLIVDNGCKVSFSMRAIGKMVQERDVIKVKKPLRIICWDEVIRPSVAKAYMGKIIESDNSLAKRENIVIEEKITPINEELFARFIYDSSKMAKETINAMEVDINQPDVFLTINESGQLVIKRQNDTIFVLTESFIRREITNYFAK
jgi:hypothetical protein